MADIGDLLKRGLISAGAYAKHVGGNVADWAMYPGKVAQAGARGEPFDLQGASDWGAGTALGMAGGGTPFAPKGAVGIGGGKLNLGGNYSVAKAVGDNLNAEAKRLGAELNKFPKNEIGLTPDAVKSSPEYQSAKQAYNSAFQNLRNFNESFTKQFSKEIKAERDARGKPDA